MVCEKCGATFPMCIVIDGKRRNLCARRHCLDCVPFKSHKRFVKDYGKCLNCNKSLRKSSKKYCSKKCEHDYHYKEFIKRWKNGDVNGSIGNAWIDVSGHIKRYLFEKYNNKCSRCGWSEINPYTNTLPLEIEHIDGNAINNREDNLTLLCPNCHSLTKTYRGANKGNGSRGIKWISRNGKTTNCENTHR